MKTNNIRIFVVEDDRFYRELITSELQAKGFSDVTAYADGAGLLNNLYRQPRIVILDYNLETTTGLDLLREIKGYDPDIQVLFLSGQDSMEVAVDTLKYGAYDYIVKSDTAANQILHRIGRIEKLQELLRQQRQYRNLRTMLFGAAGFVLLALLSLAIW